MYFLVLCCIILYFTTCLTILTEIQSIKIRMNKKREGIRREAIVTEFFRYQIKGLRETTQVFSQNSEFLGRISC